MTRRLALAVGDTAGHVMPALAVAQAYVELVGPVEIRFFAAGAGTGHWLLDGAGYPVDYLPGSQIARVDVAQQGLALARTVAGVVRARAVLSRSSTRLVIGTGGYGSASAILAARSLGLMTALIEPNVVPGLANRLLGRLTHRRYVAFAETADAFPGDRTLVTGVPIRRGSTAARSSRPAPALPRVRVLVTSGSRGEAFLGAGVPGLLKALQDTGVRPEVIHQAGSSTADVQAAYDRLGIQARVEPFIGDMSAALGWADFAITRAGAGTVAELAAAGIPALLVPLADAAHDHQTLNATALVSRGAALMWNESTWELESIVRELRPLLCDTVAWQRMSDAMRALAHHDAATRIVQDCEQLMDGRW